MNIETDTFKSDVEKNFSSVTGHKLLERLSSHLNQLMSNERLTASELGRRINVPASTIKKIRNCDTSNPTVLTLLPIANYFSLTLSQLIGDENLPCYSVHNGLQKVPLLTWQSVIQYPNVEMHMCKTISLDPPESAPFYALLIENQEFEYLPNGTILIVNPEISPQNFDLVITVKKGQKSACLKQWINDQGEYYLKNLMPGFPLVMFSEEHIILGVVTEYRKRLKHL